MNGRKLPDGGILYDESDDIEDDIELEGDAAASPVTPVDWNEGGKNETGLRGAELIAEFVKRLPNNPGVYRMFNEAGDVLYVGKARNLKKRVANYAMGRVHSNRIARMVRETANMEFVTTRTETEALLLEANLIKRLRPRFNVLLRDDKSFPYILITGDKRAPAIFKHRGARARKGDYFGPFASAGAVGRTINSLQRAFLIRTCADSVFETRTRPCLLYQIKRCSGPCTHEISDAGYAELVQEAKDFLSGKSQNVKAHMAEEMNAAAEDLDFERAAVFRDRLAALSHVQSHQGINPAGVEEADVFAIHHEGGISCIQVFFFRTGQNWGNRAYFPKADPSLSGAEVLNAFLAQFYDDKPVPRQILLSETVEEIELLAAALGEKAGHKVAILVPQRGEKRDLVDHVVANAREAHGRKLAETASQSRLLEGFKETFQLPYVPQRIEIYDNSHIMGTNAVGGMVVAGPEGFVKGQYRKFNIKQAATDDDFAMMREVFSRRFARAQAEDPDRDAGDWPDLVLIDGGRGQLNAARGVLEDMGIEDVCLVGVAKGPHHGREGREVFHLMDGRELMLPVNSPVLFYLQRLRDEVHRFAIGAHRAKRAKAIGASPLDEVPGIGPARKKALLMHFGTARSVRGASLDDLKKAPGVSAAVAQQVYDFYHSR